MSFGPGVRGAVRFGLVGAAALLSLMCDGTYEIEKSEPCRNAGYAISSRIHACTGDTADANELYNRFADELHCAVDVPVATDFRCAYNINSYDCTRVEANESDLDSWLATDGCASILVYANGEVLPGSTPPDGGSTSPFLSDPECDRVLTALAELTLVCNPNPENLSPEQIVSAELPGLEGSHQCIEAAGSAEADACVVALDGLTCVQVSAQPSFAGLLGLVPACAALLPELAAAADAGVDP